MQVLDTQGPQPLKCLKSGKTRVSEPYRTVEHIRDMNFSALPSFITSSRDERVGRHADIGEKSKLSDGYGGSFCLVRVSTTVRSRPRRRQ